MSWKRADILQVIIAGLLVVTAITITSLTIGRDIYYRLHYFISSTTAYFEIFQNSSGFFISI
jgi:hypothetical protein